MKSIRFLVLTLSASLSASLAVAAPTSAIPIGSALTAAIAEVDSRFFDAYNHCDLVTFARYTAADIEFYHDKGGVTLGREKLTASVKNNICGKVRRELIPGSLEVYPIKNFGAVEIGAHRFCELSTGRCDGVARFIHLWQYRDGAWSLTRVISYDHRMTTL